MTETQLTASILAENLNMKKTLNGYIGNCPACGYKRAFSVTQKNDRLLCYCHASQCSYKEIIASLNCDFKMASVAKPAKVAKLDNVYIKTIWNESSLMPGSIAEKYLLNRGIINTSCPNLRFHRSLYHSQSGNSFAAMVGKVVLPITDEQVAIHRTFLSPEGYKADVIPNKTILGKVKGGVLKIGALCSTTIVLCEGIETGLSLQQETGLNVWCALNAGNIQSIAIPTQIKEIIIAADADDVGIKMANKAAVIWVKQGLKVKISTPPNGKDFNDLLINKKDS